MHKPFSKNILAYGTGGGCSAQPSLSPLIDCAIRREYAKKSERKKSLPKIYYRMPKKSCPIFVVYLLLKNGEDFLDILQNF